MEIDAGVRISENLAEGYRGKVYADPRLNMRMELSSSSSAFEGSVALRAGWGIMRRPLSLVHLYPYPAYSDFVSCSFSGNDVAESLVLVQTFINDRKNSSIRPPESMNMEFGLDFELEGNSGYVFRGGKSEGNFDTSSLGYQQNVFYTGSSQYAGGSVNKPSSYEKTMRGGDGGKTIIDKNQFCEPGKGASMTASLSLDATGYGGCGGGGGYGDVDGGNGAPGYVKITWNPDKKGRGGGGSAGYSLKKTIHITNGNDKVSVQIGNGGKGGTLPWGDNAEVIAQNGGDTIFGYAQGQFNLRVGGGLGGENARLETT